MNNMQTLFFSSIANLKCALSDKKNLPLGVHASQVVNPWFDIILG